MCLLVAPLAFEGVEVEEVGLGAFAEGEEGGVCGEDVGG